MCFALPELGVSYEEKGREEEVRTGALDGFELLPCVDEFPVFIDITRSIGTRWELGVVPFRVERHRPMNQQHYTIR